MDIKELLAAAYEATVRENPKVDRNSSDFNLAFTRNAMHINRQSGNQVDVRDIARVVQNSNAYRHKVLDGFWESLGNEAKYQGAEALNTAIDMATIGTRDWWGIRRVDFGPNANDQYLSEGMKKFRNYSTTVGHQAIQAAVPGGILKGLKYARIASGSAKSNKAVKALGDVSRYVSKPVRFKKGQRLKEGTRWFVKNIVIDDPTKAAGEWRYVAIPAQGVGGGIFDYGKRDNTSRFYEGRLSDDQWAMLGLTPEEGKDLVSRYGSDWHKYTGVPDEDIQDMKELGKTYNDLPVPIQEPDPTPDNDVPNKVTPWYHHAAVGYGGGALAGGLTGYLLSSILNGGATTRLLSTFGGGTVGAILGRILQKKLLGQK